ncbi:MAG: DUF1416 domain-containing protein [Pseudonocardiaceae bacterium]
MRPLDGAGEFTAEVVSSASGQFCSSPPPGHWAVRALHGSGTGKVLVTADCRLYSVDVTVS